MTTAPRIHQLAQAAQIADLLVDRLEQHLEVVAQVRALGIVGAMSATELVAAADRVRMSETNLRRAMDAYRSVRP